MWWTPEGERVLRGAEGCLFAECVHDLVLGSLLREDEDFGVGIQVFDRLSSGQKISALLLVTNALLRTDVPHPDLTALTEGTVAAVYRHLRNNVEAEIVLDFISWRRAILRALREKGGEEKDRDK